MRKPASPTEGYKPLMELTKWVFHWTSEVMAVKFKRLSFIDLKTIDYCWCVSEFFLHADSLGLPGSTVLFLRPIFAISAQMWSLEWGSMGIISQRPEGVSGCQYDLPTSSAPDSSCVILKMPANLENSAVATGLEKVSFHSNPKKGQCQRMLKVKLLSRVWLFATPWTVAYQAPLSMGFSRQ